MYHKLRHLFFPYIYIITGEPDIPDLEAVSIYIRGLSCISIIGSDAILALLECESTYKKCLREE